MAILPGRKKVALVNNEMTVVTSKSHITKSQLLLIVM